MAKRRKVANPLALAVLSGLMLGPTHPYEMGRWLKETGKDTDFKYTRGSLYMVVEQLRKAGFIAEQETVRDTQRPERTVYAITPDGRDELYDWMRELVSQPQHEYPAFGVALSLITVLPPDEAVELLRVRLTRLDAELERLRGLVSTATEQGVAWMFLVEDDYRIAQLDTERRFVAELVTSFQRPDYARAWHSILGSKQ